MDIRKVAIRHIFQMLRIRGDQPGGIVTESQKIAGVLSQKFVITRLFVQRDAQFCKVIPGESGVTAVQLDIRKNVIFVVTDTCFHHIIGVTGIGIKASGRHHASNLEIRIDFFTDPHRAGTCHQLVMRGIVHDLVELRVVLVHQQATAQIRDVGDHVDLIEGHPVFYQIPVAVKHGGSIFSIQCNQPAVCPGTIFPDQGFRHIKVAQGDHRLYPVPTTLRKQFLVKTQAIFVRGVLFPGRIDPRP